MKCGLLGRRLGHSYSPQIHKTLGSYSYSLFEVEPEELEQFLRSNDFQGLNVTIPYKKAVIPFLSELSPEAAKIGAVTTLVRRADGSLIGHNTDAFGFRSMAVRSGLNFSKKKVLVLGSGGASDTVFSVMEDLGAHPVRISRSGPNHYGNLFLHADASAIVNATPVGMFPDTEKAPLTLEGFPALEGVLDVIYNPSRTQVLLEAERRGLVTENGLWMLVAQAKESAEWFTGKKIPDDKIGRIYRALRVQMENIILVGMPGSGKTTVGKALAASLHRQFLDADTVLETSCRRTILEIFQKDGESVATGGGCVTRAENYPLLHSNGTIFWLNREIQKLPTDGRPLSQSGSLDRMYAVREPMYRAFADYAVENNGSLQNTLEQIMLHLEAEK